MLAKFSDCAYVHVFIYCKKFKNIKLITNISNLK